MTYRGARVTTMALTGGEPKTFYVGGGKGMTSVSNGILLAFCGAASVDSQAVYCVV